MALGLFFFVLSPLWGPLPIGFRATSEMVFEGEILPFLCFGYLVICFISLVYWLKGKRVWRYSILGLGLIHFVGSSYLLELCHGHSPLCLFSLRFIFRELVSLCFYLIR